MRQNTFTSAVNSIVEIVSDRLGTLIVKLDTVCEFAETLL